MDETTFIIRLYDAEDVQPKHFGNIESARKHAKKTIDDEEAAAAQLYKIVGKGRPELLQTFSRHASDSEAERASKAAWEEALAKKDTDTMLKLLGL